MSSTRHLLRGDESTRAVCAAAICAPYAVLWCRVDLNDASESHLLSAQAYSCTTRCPAVL